MHFTILAGGYSSFIAGYLFNATTCKLTLQGKYQTADNPSWISPNAKGDVLYAVNEITQGAVQSYSINSNGILSGPLDTVGTGGDGPAFCAQLSNGKVAAMNYGSGDGSFTPTTINGKTFGKPTTFVNFPTPPYLPPKNVSHPHMVLEYNDEVFVPDLGADQIWRLKVREDGSGYQIVGSIPQPEGSGPRHIAIHDDRIFTLHETSSSLSAQSIPDSPTGTAKTFASVSIIPPNPPPGAIFAAAEILIPPSSAKFPKSYIYVSNRNIGISASEGDSIAIFEYVKHGQHENLVLRNQIFTGLNQIRGMAIGKVENGGEEYLMAGAASGSGGVAIFQRTEGGKNLKILARNTDISNRTSFAWL